MSFGANGAQCNGRSAEKYKLSSLFLRCAACAHFLFLCVLCGACGAFALFAFFISALRSRCSRAFFLKIRAFGRAGTAFARFHPA